ncbi:hypothetical protein [Delftia acidovorans]|uniref:Transposase n=1 Tax=Delftia acidovorans TaxID=80866 RepID=A0AAJ2R6J3_DELAC|nr:hypothetical protein [Delftia acidovorans]MDX4956560.1 hypothetical protein [Delftia acidovorans]
MLVDAVERRFGVVEAMPQEFTLELLTDNGNAYITHETRGIARSLGLMECFWSSRQTPSST